MYANPNLIFILLLICAVTAVGLVFVGTFVVGGGVTKRGPQSVKGSDKGQNQRRT